MRSTSIIMFDYTPPSLVILIPFLKLKLGGRAPSDISKIPKVSRTVETILTTISLEIVTSVESDDICWRRGDVCGRSDPIFRADMCISKLLWRQSRYWIITVGDTKVLPIALISDEITKFLTTDTWCSVSIQICIDTFVANFRGGKTSNCSA